MSDDAHELRCWPQFFQAVWDGDKTFEVRRDDRGFEVGHALMLREYDPELDERAAGERYTGRELTASVTYVLRGNGFGVESGFVVLGIKLLQRATASARMPKAGAEG